jgi:hypothetical protein
MGRPKGYPKTGGRKKGSGDKRFAAVREIVAEAVATNRTPLEYMLSVLNNPAETPDRRMAASIAAAPYCHPRLNSVEAKVAVTAEHRISLKELAERAEREIDEAFREWTPPEQPKVIEHQPSPQEPEPPHRPAEDYVREGVIEPASEDVVRLKDRYRLPRPPYSTVGH